MSEYEVMNTCMLYISIIKIADFYSKMCNLKTLAMSLFLILAASLSCLPLIHSVARLGVECIVSMVRNAQMTSTTLCHHALSFVQPRRGDGRAAAEGLELGINNLSIVVNLLK